MNYIQLKNFILHKSKLYFSFPSIIGYTLYTHITSYLYANYTHLIFFRILENVIEKLVN